jgi:hypothetical protein
MIIYFAALGFLKRSKWVSLAAKAKPAPRRPNGGHSMRRGLPGRFLRHVSRSTGLRASRQVSQCSEYLPRFLAQSLQRPLAFCSLAHSA